jgi:hypothetical protein
VFGRYLEVMAGRVKEFGGNPMEVLSSPTGDGKRGHPHPGPAGGAAIPSATGKIAGLVFDRFGDFEGFTLDSRGAERKFFSREVGIAEIAERAWRERLRVTVWAEPHESSHPLRIVIHQPPTTFR